MMRKKMAWALLFSMIATAWAHSGARAEEACLPDLEKPYGVMEEVKRVRREINLHNLYNGLHLSVAQMERILACAEKACRLRDELYGERSSRARDILGAYREVLGAVREGRRIPRPVEGMGFLMELAEKRLAKKYFEGMAALEKEVWTTLTPAQQDVFKGYEPCLIPPKNLKDPVRVGQASSHEEERKILDHCRRFPEAEFDRECRRLLSVHMANLEKFLGRMNPKTRNAELDRMVEVCRRARALTEVDFAMRGEAFAEELSLGRQKDMFKAKAEELMDLFRQFQGGSIGNVAKHFLDPMVVTVLKGRIEGAKNAPAPGAKDLAGVEGARAKGTKCALKPSDELSGVKRKYSAGELCKILDLKGERARKFRDVVGKAKAAQARIFQIPMKGGKTPLQAFLEIQGLPPGKRATAGAELMQKLSEPIPHRDCSHMEYLTRLQISLANQLEGVLTAPQYEKLESTVGDFLDQIEAGEKIKPHLRDVSAKLGLDGDQFEEVQKAARRGQVKAFKILSIPNEDGRKPLESILIAASTPPSLRGKAFQSFMELLLETIPGRKTTYAEELERIKTETERAFGEIMKPDQFRRYMSMKIDLLDLQLDEE
ncbi:MAG: hypothetical protein ACYTFG_15230 [Planctomycetota bacterium]